MSSYAARGGVGLRRLLLIACVGYFLSKELQPLLLPYGSAVIVTERQSFKQVDLSNDRLMGRHGKLSKIYERLDDEDDLEAEPLLKGPETVVFNPKSGTMYVLTEEALLVSLTEFQTHQRQDESKHETTIVTAKATKVVDLGMGRPLGGKFTPDGKTIYIADAFLGLIRVVNPHDFPKSKVELVASQVLDNGTMTRIINANDVAIGPKTGKVYFTDGTYTGHA
jgi:DNA-binding beta-propeller fold protein YncE